MGTLETQEPRFYEYWRAHQVESDPQLERWIQYEGEQMSVARERIKELAGYFPLAGRRILDVGCQWGATTIALAEIGADAVGIDVDPDCMRGAQIRAGEHGAEPEFLHAGAEMLPFADRSFDGVICANVIEHVASHHETVRETARVLKPGGHLYIDGPNRLSPHQLWRDPHYQLRGISVLPPWLGQPYVMRVRGFPRYGVGRFPVATRLERRLQRAGLRIIASSRRRPDWKGLVRFNVDPMFHMVGEKR